MQEPNLKKMNCLSKKKYIFHDILEGQNSLNDKSLSSCIVFSWLPKGIIVCFFFSEIYVTNHLPPLEIKEGTDSEEYAWKCMCNLSF